MEKSELNFCAFTWLLIFHYAESAAALNNHQWQREDLIDNLKQEKLGVE